MRIVDIYPLPEHPHLEREPFFAHESWTSDNAVTRVQALLAAMGVPDPTDCSPLYERALDAKRRLADARRASPSTLPAIRREVVAGRIAAEDAAARIAERRAAETESAEARRDLRRALEVEAAGYFRRALRAV
ncbi:MAG: hypothetical protein U0446_11755 [Dehalococcoidia bacterium]